MRRENGFSLVELIVATAIFGIFILILASLEAHLRRLDRSSRVDLMTHPENVSVLTRLRGDTLSARGYPASFAGHVQTPYTLIFEREPPLTVVWVFDGARATRHQYSGGSLQTTWVANSVPRYLVSSYEMPDGAVAVRIQGRDAKGRLAVDEIFTPRTQ